MLFLCPLKVELEDTGVRRRSLATRKVIAKDKGDRTCGDVLLDEAFKHILQTDVRDSKQHCLIRSFLLLLVGSI